MLNKIKTAALSALIGLGTIAAIPATAQAEGIYLNYGNANGQFGVYTGVRDRDHGAWRERNDDNSWNDRWDNRSDRRWDRRSNRCSADRALDKAERLGLWRVRIVDVGRHTVKVSGRKFGNRVTVVFGNERGCPILYR